MTDSHAEHDLEAKQAIVENIEKYGCFLALFEADNYMPAFAYSIGLYEKYKHPEIICFGLSIDLMGQLINHARDLIQSGEVFSSGKVYSDFLEEGEICFLPVDQLYYQDYLGYGKWYYNINFGFPVLQMVWSDKNGKFPYEAGFNEDWKFDQPLLDRNTNFRFYEERNLGVYTTRQVLAGELVRYVYHNEDGDWQFHSSNAPDMDDAVLVSLDSLVKLDNTLNDIYFLQYGWKAWREKAGDKWEYDVDNEDK